MIQIEQLTKIFVHGDGQSLVLDHLDFSIDAGEIYAVLGPSGAGKTTLAQCVSLLERPTSGSVVVNGDTLSQLTEKQLRIARRRIGTIFQSDGLFTRRTVAANIALPLEYLGVTPAESKKRVAELLDRVGLADKAKYYPHQLSGGQRQRIGIARALALRPSVLLSDEATSGLDPEATTSVVNLLKELRDDLNLAILFITHEMDTVLQVADSVARLDHGHIVESGRLVDLLSDPASGLGRALQPRRRHQDAPAAAAIWHVTYGRTPVASDWITRMACDLDANVSLLGASIENVRGATVGHATVSVSALDHDRVAGVLAGLGLHPRRESDTQSAALEDVA